MGCNGKKIILIGLLLVVINLLFSVLPGEVGAGTTPPGAITNLSALTGSNVGEIDLSWSAPGDNDYTGDIVGGKYRIDYSTDPLYNFTTYYYKIEFSTDTSPGDPQSYTLDSLNQTTYYIRVYTADEVPNWSPLSNGATAFPGAPSTGTVTLSASTIDGYIEASDEDPDKFYRMTTDDFITCNYWIFLSSILKWDRGFVEWDISSIPDDATITDVVFKYHGQSNHASSLCYIYSMENQPSDQPNTEDDPGGNKTIWDDAANGNAYLSDSSAFPEIGESKEIDLGSLADSDLQSNLTTNWFAIGLKNDEGTQNQADRIYSSRYGTVNPPPTLYVTFSYADDTIPPASITNLSALTGDIGGQVKLTWTAPGDDGTSGDIAGGKYRIKYSQNSNYNWNVSDYDIEWTTNTTPGASQSRVVENLTPGATYYFRIWTGDEIPNWSTVSNPANAWAYIEDIDPSAITDLQARTLNQIELTWTAPGDNGTDGQASFYNIRYSTTSPFDWDTATVWKSSRATTGPYGTPETEAITGLTPGTTYYFRIKAYDPSLNWSLSNQTTAQAGTFALAGEPMGTDKGVSSSSLAFGDYDNDGDLDLAVSGIDDSSYKRLILFKNTNGNFTEDQNPMGGTSGVYNSSLAFGDYDNDGDLDLAVSGLESAFDRRLILFKNNDGNFTEDQNPMGGIYGSLAFGDYDNDGDLDLAVSGEDGLFNNRLILLKNDNGNFSEEQNPMGGTNGVTGSIAFGDYDNDGDLDLAVSGTDDSNRRLILFKNNNGNFTIDQNPMGGTDKGVYLGSLAFGDYDNDGDLDLAVSGDDGTNYRLILFKNNNGNFTSDQNPMGGTDGVYNGSLAFGDYDNDGDLDLAVSGEDDGGYIRLILFKNNNGTFTQDQNPMGGTDKGVYLGSLAFGDYDNDGDLDLAVSGDDDLSNERLIIYKNMEKESGNANTVPGLPQNLTGLYNEGIIKLSWSSATDGGSNPTPQDGLYYNIRVGTGTEVSASSSVVTGIYGSPMMGNYLRPKLTNSVYGVRISSIGLTANTTYYWTVQAIDTPLNAGGWASLDSVYVPTVGTPQAPAAITNLSALTGDYGGEVKLSWSAPGDDGGTGDITDGRYGIKYATYTTYDFNGPSAFDLEWSTNTSPGNSETKVVPGLTEGVTYYFRIWTADEVLNWSGISNGATTWAQSIAPAAITNLSALTQANEGEVKLSWSAPGDDEWDNPISGGKYGVKWSTYSSFDWDGATDFDLEWTTSTSPGNSESKLITGLVGAATYYFRIWTADEVPNWSSGLSNGATVWVTGVAPAAITNLFALTEGNPGEAKLSWSAPGDDGWDDPISGGKYGVKWSTYSSFDWGGASNFDLEWSTSTSPGADESKIIGGLGGGATYYFRIWTADEVPNWSGISNGATTWVVIAPDSTSPGAITNLSALTGSNVGEIDLSWSAPGDDGYTEDIVGGKYRIDYSTDPLYNFTTYYYKIEFSTDTSPGDPQSYTLDSLNQTTYYIRVYTADEVPNWSPLSNGATAFPGAPSTGTVILSGITIDGYIEAQDTGASPAADIWIRQTSNNDIPFYYYLFGGDGRWDRGFIEWDISSIPDGATITDVVFKYHGEANYASSDCDIYQMQNQPSAQPDTTGDPGGNKTIYDDAAEGNGYVLSHSTFPEVGETKEIDLGSSANSDLQSNLTTNWFAIGLKNDEGTADQKDSIYSSRYGEVTPPPTLYVTFIPGDDSTPPASITNLSALTGDIGGQVKLTWTAPGDDGTSGDIVGGKYRIKYSQDSNYNWNVSNYDIEWTTYTTPGEAQSRIVENLTPGATYYFRIWTGDEIPNWSTVSNPANAWAKIIVVGANRYWVGVTANWDDANNWSATSGGGGGVGVPGAEDTAIFDGGDTTSCYIDISSTVASVIIYSTYTATISINSGKSLTTSGSFEIAGGTFTTNGEILDVGSYTQTGGIFNAGGSTVTCNGDFSVTVGTFNAGASVLVLDVTDGDATFTGDGYTFNNVIFQSTATVARTWTLGAGAITFNGDFQLKAQGNGNLTVTAITNNPDLDIGGSVDYTGTGAGTELLSMGEGTWTVGGNVDFSGGTVDASTSTFVLNGTSTQTLTMDGNNLNILQITNSSSDGVYFADNLTLSTFTATTGNTHLYFCGSSTFTFTNINFDGQSESSRIVLKSTSTGTAWYLNVSGNQSVSYVDVEDSDASDGDTILAIDGTSVNSGNNIKWDFGPPAAITDLTGLCDSDTGDVTLSWSTPGDDDWTGTLPSGSKYIIDYSTYSIQWSTNTYDVEIATSGVAPYTEVSHTITGLTGDSTYYFRIWTRDDIPTNWSGLSNGATVWVNSVLSVSISTNTINLGVVEPGSYALTVSSVVVTNNGNIKQKFKLKIVSEPNATWESVTATSPGAEQYRYSGIFCSTQPVTSDFLSEDSFSVSTERTSSSADLARDADPDEQKGFNVSPDNTRNLWFKFEAPTSTDITTTQAIPLTITAEPYP